MSQLSKALKKAERGIGKLIPHQSAASKRAEMYAVQEQISLYQQQKAQLHAESERLAGERAQEKRRLHEKQIRALRAGYSRGGFMDSSNTSGPSETLG